MARKVPEFPSFSFSSGHVVSLRLLGPNTLSNIGRAVSDAMEERRPKPPIEMINGVAVPNDAHPDYLAALEAFDSERNVETGHRIMKLIANYAVIKDYDEADIAAYREAMTDVGVTLPEDETDAFVFVWHICATSQDEIRAFIEFALNQGRPTRESTTSHVETFQGNVQGPASMVSASDEVRVES